MTLLETALILLGLRIQPPLSSLLLSYGRSYLVNACWIAVLPGIVPLLCTLSISLICDRVCDPPTRRFGSVPKLKAQRYFTGTIACS